VYSVCCIEQYFLMLYCFIMCRIKIKFSYSYSYSYNNPNPNPNHNFIATDTISYLITWLPIQKFLFFPSYKLPIMEHLRLYVGVIKIQSQYEYLHMNFISRHCNNPNPNHNHYFIATNTISYLITWLPIQKFPPLSGEPNSSIEFLV
jgi:hypothetical protein